MGTDQSKPSEMLVFIDFDGAAYELTERDKSYVDTEFAPGDGGAPSVKCDYGSRNGWGLLDGYLLRSKLPEGLPIHPAPERPPLTHRARTERLRALAADATTSESKARLLELVRVAERLEVFDEIPEGTPPGVNSRRD